MSFDEKKFLDKDGLLYLISKMQEYPTNDILGTIINAIDETKADIESPNFLGIPTAPTAEKNTSSSQIATTEFVSNNFISDEKLNDLIEIYLIKNPPYCILK